MWRTTVLGLITNSSAMSALLFPAADIAAKLDVNRGRVERALKAGALGQLPGEPAASPSPPSLAADNFVGYQRELAELQACLEDTLHGHRSMLAGAFQVADGPKGQGRDKAGAKLDLRLIHPVGR